MENAELQFHKGQWFVNTSECFSETQTQHLQTRTLRATRHPWGTHLWGTPWLHITVEPQAAPHSGAAHCLLPTAHHLHPGSPWHSGQQPGLLLPTHLIILPRFPPALSLKQYTRKVTHFGRYFFLPIMRSKHARLK